MRIFYISDQVKILKVILKSYKIQLAKNKKGYILVLYSSIKNISTISYFPNSSKLL